MIQDIWQYLVHNYNRLARKMRKVLMPLGLLFFRLWLAFVLFQAVFQQWAEVPPSSFNLTFLGSIPLFIAAVLLGLGLFVRLVAIALLVFVVLLHPVEQGFSLFYKGALVYQAWLLMLGVLITFGAGRFSLDRQLGIL